jgi:hypothetical protein
MASYSPGQTVCVAHTVKNHVAAPCTNPYIPEHGQTFYIFGKDLAADPTMRDIMNWQTLKGRDGEHVTPSFDYRGFQNAPGFCMNLPSMDKATATACFDLPGGLAPGIYGFIWVWNFNSPTDTYTTCWEARVGGVPPPLPTPRPTPSTTARPFELTAPPRATPVPQPVPQPTLTPPKSQRICFDAVGVEVV